MAGGTAFRESQKQALNRGIIYEHHLNGLVHRDLHEIPSWPGLYQAIDRRVPAGLDLAATASLLCSGVMTYSPRRHWKVGRNQRLALSGWAALGQMGVKFSRAFGAHVVLFTTSPNKIADGVRLGAQEVVISKDADAMKKHQRSFNFILDAVSALHDINAYRRARNPKKPVFDLTSGPPFCHSAHMETHALGSGSWPNAPEGQKRFPTSPTWVIPVHAGLHGGLSHWLGPFSKPGAYQRTGLKSVYWGIGTNPGNYSRIGALPCPPDRVQALAKVKTRLTNFGDEHRNASIKWGYAVCDKSIRACVPEGPPPSDWPRQGGLGN